MSGLFSGIMVDVAENGYELSMEDVHIQFNEAFEVLNAEAANFESFCGAIEKLELLNKSIQENGGKADKGVIAFLNQNNSLASALGINLSMESFDPVVAGSEISAACEGVVGSVWEAIKNFFKNIWDGIKNFFKNFAGLFKSTESKLSNVVNNPKVDSGAKKLQYTLNKGAAAGANISVSPSAAKPTSAPTPQPNGTSTPAAAPTANNANQASYSVKPTPKVTSNVTISIAKAAKVNVPDNKKVVIKSDGISKLIDKCKALFEKCAPLFNATTIEQLAAANVQPLSDNDLANAKAVPADSIVLGDDLVALCVSTNKGLVDESKILQLMLNDLKQQYANAQKCEKTFTGIIAEAEKMASQAGTKAEGIDKAKSNVKCIIQCVGILGTLISYIDKIATDYNNVANVIANWDDDETPTVNPT